MEHNPIEQQVRAADAIRAGAEYEEERATAILIRKLGAKSRWAAAAARAK